MACSCHVGNTGCCNSHFRSKPRWSRLWKRENKNSHSPGFPPDWAISEMNSNLRMICIGLFFSIQFDSSHKWLHFCVLTSVMSSIVFAYWIFSLSVLFSPSKLVFNWWTDAYFCSLKSGAAKKIQSGISGHEGF